jgi:hypothetical protein
LPLGAVWCVLSQNCHQDRFQAQVNEDRRTRTAAANMGHGRTRCHPLRSTLCGLVVVDLSPVLINSFSFSLAGRALPHNHIWYTCLCLASVA